MTRSAPHPRPGSAGFTLMETLVSLAVGMTAALALLTFHRAEYFAVQDQTRQIDLQSTGRTIVDLFAREARRAGADPVCSKAFEAVTEASSGQVRLFADLDRSGAIDGQNEDLLYRLEVGNRRILRVARGVSDELIDNVDLTGSRFRYFDGSGVELVPNPTLTAAQRALVRRIRIELLLAQKMADPEKRALLNARAATDVNLRNRFFLASTACP